MIFRALTLAETEPAKRLLRAAFADYVASLGRAPDPGAHDTLGDKVAAGRVMGAFGDEAMTAVAVTGREPDGAWMLESLAVDPNRQRDGLGRKLLCHVIAEARAAGAPAIRLHTVAAMSHLVALYSAHGFRKTGLGPPLHGLDAHPRAFMEKRL